jgi:hypothetical protein
VSHVVVWDTVLSSMRIDVHDVSVGDDSTKSTDVDVRAATRRGVPFGLARVRPDDAERGTTTASSQRLAIRPLSAGVSAWEVPELLLEPYELGPESIPFVFELGDSFAKVAILDDGCRCGGWIDKALGTLAEADAVGAHAFRVRGPLPRSTGSGALVVHSMQREVTTSRITTRILAARPTTATRVATRSVPMPGATRWTFA